MIPRGSLLRGVSILALLIVAMSIMAILTIQLVASSSQVAYDGLARDLGLHQRVERGLHRLIDASRTFVSRPDELQRVRVARIQRELEPDLDTLAARARTLQVSTASQIETSLDRCVGWLAVSVAEQPTPEAFEQMLATWRPIIQVDLDAFVSAADVHGRRLLGDATALSRRATLGIGVVSLLALLTTGLLGLSAVRHHRHNQRRGRSL